jgi:hypothetical protein
MHESYFFFGFFETASLTVVDGLAPSTASRTGP